MTRLERRIITMSIGALAGLALYFAMAHYVRADVPPAPVPSLAITKTGTGDGPQTVHWGQAGNWEIKVDRTLADGCFAITQYMKGTIVRFGIDRTTKRLYLLYADTRWPALTVGDKHHIFFIFDDGAKNYEANLKVVDIHGMTGLYHDNTSGAFFEDFAKRNVMQVENNSHERMARLSLDQTQQAVDGVIACQKEMNR